MRNITIALILFAGLTTCAFAQPATESIKWISITEAEKLAAKEPKKIIVDVYTDWCGWCKRLDATTYKDPKVVKYINEKYYAVKLNAESKEPISYQGQEHTFDPAKRINTVAALFLNSPSYPTTTFLDEKLQVISIVPGYMAADMMSNVLHYFADNHYLSTDWDSYLSSLSNSAVPKQ